MRRQGEMSPASLIMYYNFLFFKRTGAESGRHAVLNVVYFYEEDVG